jgi:hypothetical protein
MAKNSSFRRYTNISVLLALAFLLALTVASFLLYEPSSSELGGQGGVTEGGGS